MQVLNGFVKIHRKLVGWGWYQDNVVKGVFLHLLLTANFKEMKWQGLIIGKGQLVTNYNRLADDLGFTVQQNRTAIKKLKSTGEITVKTTNKFSLITIVNWEDYQYIDEKPTGKLTRTTTNEQQTNNNQITNKQQTNNKPSYIKKNDKNVKNEKNIYARTRVRDSLSGIEDMSPDEIEKRIEELRR